MVTAGRRYLLKGKRGQGSAGVRGVTPRTVTAHFRFAERAEPSANVKLGSRSVVITTLHDNDGAVLHGVYQTMPLVYPTRPVAGHCVA